LFVAVWPPSDVLDRVAALDKPDVEGVRWTTRDQWHVTLRFLGSMTDAAPVVDALSMVNVPGGVVVAGPEVRRLSNRILVLPVAGLDALASAVEGATATLGEPPPERPFRGHLTLARARGRVDLRPLIGAAINGSWSVEEFSLVNSTLHPQGARYETVAAFPLPRIV
jgi:2'-5' RNA ligase